MKLPVSQFNITYPEHYKGSFDTKEIEVRVVSGVLEITPAGKETRVIEIVTQEPVPARSKVELILSNVQNPSFGGMFYFNCQVLSPGGVQIPRYLGTWIISIS